MRESELKITRRGVAATAVAAAAIVAEAPRVLAQATEPSWEQKFVWVAPEGGVPETPYSPDGKFGTFPAVLEPGQVGVGVFSQFIYDRDDPITGSQMQIPGRENHPVVVVVSSNPNGTVAREFHNMPVKGGWFGLVQNPSGGAATVQEANQVVLGQIAALRNPALNNCAPGVGCQGPIEYIVIGPDGDVTDHGYRTK